MKHESRIQISRIKSADPAPEKETRKGKGMGWGAFGNHCDIMNNNLPLSMM